MTPLPKPEVDFDDEEYLTTADLSDWYSLRSLCQIARNTCAFTRYPDQQPPSPQPNQVEMFPEPEHLDIDIPEDIPDLINVPKTIIEL